MSLYSVQWSWAVSCISNISVGNHMIHHSPKDPPPPLQTFSANGIIAHHLVSKIWTTHKRSIVCDNLRAWYFLQSGTHTTPGCSHAIWKQRRQSVYIFVVTPPHHGELLMKGNKCGGTSRPGRLSMYRFQLIGELLSISSCCTNSSSFPGKYVSLEAILGMSRSCPCIQCDLCPKRVELASWQHFRPISWDDGQFVKH